MISHKQQVTEQVTRQHPISNEVANEQVRTSQTPVNNSQSVSDVPTGPVYPLCFDLWPQEPLSRSLKVQMEAQERPPGPTWDLRTGGGGASDMNQNLEVPPPAAGGGVPSSTIHWSAISRLLC